MNSAYRTCRSCGGECPKDAQFCIECGAQLQATIGPTTKLATTSCPACGTTNIPDARFCVHCGQVLNARQPVRPVAPARPVTPPVAFPRTMQPPVMPRPVYRQQRQQRHGDPPPAVMILVIGFGILALMHLISLPLVLLILGAAFLVHQAERGRINQGIKTVAIAAIGMLVITHPRYWPVMIFGFILMRMFSRRKIF